MSRSTSCRLHIVFAEVGGKETPPGSAPPPTVAGRPNTLAVCLGSLAMGVERPREAHQGKFEPKPPLTPPQTMP